MRLAARESKGKHQQDSNKAALARRALISAGMGFVLLAVLMTLAAAASLRLDFPQGRMSLVAIPIAGLAAFVAGYLNVRPRRTQGLAFGVLAAAALFLPTILAAAIISRETPGIAAFITLAVMLLCGAAGGVVAANKTPSKSAKARKKKK